MNSGTCYNKPGSFECKCPDGYDGERCENGISSTKYIIKHLLVDAQMSFSLSLYGIKIAVCLLILGK